MIKNMFPESAQYIKKCHITNDKFVLIKEKV